MLRTLTLIILFLACHQAIAQLTIDKGYYPRLIIPKGTDAEVMLDDVEIDTLVMDDNSSLKFVWPRHALRVKCAHLRGAVTWKGAGKEGRDAGSKGDDGADLDLQVTFFELGRLLIDTRGGPGSSGKTPKAKPGYYTLANPGNGGNGGGGGNINFKYKCINFTPRFDSGKKNAIRFKTKGGSGGSGGFPNKESNVPKITAGPQGKMGEKGKDGEVVLSEM